MVEDDTKARVWPDITKVSSLLRQHNTTTSKMKRQVEKKGNTIKVNPPLIVFHIMG
jgi:hypothetical protein